ncbi:BCCT family transporter [Nigerium massiliense]|uniref:BCCT family transporter n=1 Tax=Nigerium massiliense TaxID=1522317 RepID=UPI0006933F51|nr:BCCT family transporter [Nigerium massiliense]
MAGTPDRSNPTDIPRRYALSKPVFFVSAGIILLAVLFALLLPDAFDAVVSGINGAVVDSIGWYYVLVVTVFVAFSIVVAVSRFGDVKLGRDDDEPEYSTFSWFAMLFAAGMGIGLVFWGAAEPLSFFAGKGTIPPNAQDLEGPARAQRAMGQTLLHWGLHAWATYVVVGLAVAYAAHRRGRPISIRWALEPVLGKYTDTWAGDLVDITAVIGTIFGIATSLGFGVNQIFAGLAHLGLVPGDMQWLKIVMVVAITGLATLSAASGVDKGIKMLSNANLTLAAVLLVAVLALGPTVFLLRDFVSGIGYYLSNFVSLSFQTLPFYGDAGAAWLNGWTVNYWGWWISWSPFVGVFIARISRGRTVREFITGVLLVPTLVTIIWFTVMGGTAISQMVLRGLDLRQPDGTINPDTALFDVFNNLPAGPLLSGIAILLVTIFFITSADSGAFVVDMIAHGGDPQPPRITRVFWASASGLIAAALIAVALPSGGDSAGMAGLQALALVAAAPFSVVMIGMMVSVWRELRRELTAIERLERKARQREFAEEYSDAFVDRVTDQVVDTLSHRRR